MLKVDDFLEKYEALCRSIKKGFFEDRLMHAFLVTEGTFEERLLFSYFFAAEALSITFSEPFVRQLSEAGHVNVHVVKREGAKIKKEQIDALRHDVMLKALEQKRKVFIIEDIEMLSIAAANSLLKFLEEPAAGIYVLLLTEKQKDVLATIASRAGIFRLAQADEQVDAWKEMIEKLEKQPQLASLFLAEVAKKERQEIASFLRSYGGYLRSQVKTSDLRLVKALDTTCKDFDRQVLPTLCLHNLAVALEGKH